MQQTPFSLGTATLTDAVYDAVRTRIINGQIAPGERVTEARLSTEYGVARPTAKACIERLVLNGLLIRSAHKTSQVPILTADGVKDLYLSRFAVERSAVELLAERRSIPDSVHDAQAGIRSAMSGQDFPGIVAADARFHAAIVSETASARLTRMHEMILGEVALTMGMRSAHESEALHHVYAEHKAVLDGIESGAADSAVAALRMHLKGAELRVLARIHEAPLDAFGD